jgi:hypothetical protein
MSYLQKQMNQMKYDKRLLEINLKQGNITREEYDQYVENLADSAGNSMKLELSPETEDSRSYMNGDSHPASPKPPTMPTNSDPFGSGF